MMMLDPEWLTCWDLPLSFVCSAPSVSSAGILAEPGK